MKVTEHTKKRFVELVERIMIRWGYMHVDGVIYGTLLLSGRPLRISEIKERAGLSHSSVSTSLNRLLRDYLVTVTKKGRVKFFSPVPAFLEKFLRQPRELLEMELVPLKETTKNILSKNIEEKNKTKLPELLDNLEKLEKVLKELIKAERKVKMEI